MLTGRPSWAGSRWKSKWRLKDGYVEKVNKTWDQAENVKVL